MKYSKICLLIIMFLGLSIGVAHSSPIPIVEELTGPTGPVNLNDNSATYTFTATVFGGQPPYTYRWEARGNLIEESEASSITLDSSEMAKTSNGAGYWVYLTITDANGKKANYVEEGELQTQFVIGVTVGGIITHPSSFPYTYRVDGQDIAPEDNVVEYDPDSVEPVENDSGVRFSGLDGQVEVLFPGETEWDFAELSTALPEGTRIKTEESSSCVLSFTDMSTFILPGGSEVIISTARGKESKLDLIAGQVYTRVKKMITTGSMEVKMNQAVAGAKGTTFVCIQESGFSILLVIEGIVEFTNTETNQVLDIEGGESVYVRDGVTNDVESFDIQWEQDKWTPYIEQFDIEVSEGLQIIDTTNENIGTNDDEPESITNMIPAFPIFAIGVAVLLFSTLGRRGKQSSHII